MIRFRFVIALLTVVILLAGCTSNSSTTQTSTISTTSQTTTQPYTAQTASKAGIGNYLVDAKGMTLYYFAKDVFGTSNAAGAVLQNWPVFYAQNIVIPSNLDAGDFTTITRPDGSKQTAYYGWPLYYYAGDKAPGDIKGDNVGGVWFLVKVPWYTVLIQSKAGIGDYLADTAGMTLYWTTKDAAGQSNISGTTLANWPVFYSTADSAPLLVIPSALNTLDFGTITRSDGSKQTTFKGWPLYYYVQDKKSGDTNGQGVGGVWFTVNITASGPAAPPAQTSTTTPTTSTSTSTPTTSSTPGAAVNISLTAQSFSFDKSSITVTAGAGVTINFNNKDSGTPHNFALYTNSSAATSIFVGQTITGPSTVVYTFTAPTAPGTYFFRCDVHPTTMTGSFIVTAAGNSTSTSTTTSTPGGGGGGY
jgi:predicted lipoprotein with Yx(FWY)xxD motif/plastocyanin